MNTEVYRICSAPVLQSLRELGRWLPTRLPVEVECMQVRG